MRFCYNRPCHWAPKVSPPYGGAMRRPLGFLFRKGKFPMMRFDRFTERAQEAAQRAAEIIQRYGHNQIDTEHILLALIEQPGGVIPQILEKLSVSPEALTERLDATLRASPKANIFGGGAGQIFITPRVKRIIDLANEEAN